MNNNISQSSETDSSLKSSGMNQISLDTLFSNLNKSLKNKFNSQNISNPNVSINSTSDKKYIDFFKINQNYQSPNIKVLQHSPTAKNYQNNSSYNPENAQIFNCPSVSQAQNPDPKNIELVQLSSGSFSLKYPESSLSQSITSDNKSNSSDVEKISKVKPSFSFNFNNDNQKFQTCHIPTLTFRPCSSGSYSFNNSSNNNSFKNFKLSPAKLNFLPSQEWKNYQNELSLESLISTYFRASFSSKIHFEHKLWNALQITLYSPQLFSFVGVRWASKTIIQVNQEVFGSFLDLKKVISALFTSKGSFPSHGFIEITDIQTRVESKDKISQNELSECRFFEHRDKLFRMDSNEDEIASIQYEAHSI